jgi:hypothetical protein
MEKNEFIALVKKTKLKPYSIRMAYRALVLGEKNINIANIYGVKRQVVEQAKRRVLHQQKIENNIPKAWEHISMHLPSELVKAVSWLEEHAKHQDGLIVKRSKKPPELSTETIELISNLLCSKAS